MADFVNSSALTKLLANVFVFIVLMAAVGIAIYDSLAGQPVNPYIATLIGGGLTYAIGILGVHVGGVQALQAQAAAPPSAALPLPPAPPLP